MGMDVYPHKAQIREFGGIIFTTYNKIPFCKSFLPSRLDGATGEPYQKWQLGNGRWRMAYNYMDP